jgi:hypothetical protein
MDMVAVLVSFVSPFPSINPITLTSVALRPLPLADDEIKEVFSFECAAAVNPRDPKVFL